MYKKPKSIDSLMKYLRNGKNIYIKGSVQKKKLQNIGYYHGYKGYRFIGSENNKISYTLFSELETVYDFDSQLKALFYPHVMKVETALKNRVLEVVIDETESEDFVKIYGEILDNYKNYSPQKREYKEAIKKRLELRDRIYKTQSLSYGRDNNIAVHFLSNNRSMPIWAIFELMTLGEFGTFVSCMNKNSRQKVSMQINIRQSDDNNSTLVQRLIYALKDFRNAIAHNNVVFDTRFKTASIKKQVSSAIGNATNINNVNFISITDYLILIIYLEKILDFNKKEMRKLVTDYDDMTEKLRKKIPISIYNRIIFPDEKKIIQKLKCYISR